MTRIRACGWHGYGPVHAQIHNHLAVVVASMGKGRRGETGAGAFVVAELLNAFAGVMVAIACWATRKSLLALLRCRLSWSIFDCFAIGSD